MFSKLTQVLLLGLCLGVSPPIFSQSGTIGQARQLWTTDYEDPQIALQTTLEEQLPGYQLIKINQQADPAGQQHWRYQIKYGEYELYGQQVLMHELAIGQYRLTYPAHLPDPSKLDISINENAWRAALEILLDETDFSLKTFDYALVADQLDYDQNKLQLAAVLELQSVSSHRHERWYLSATTGRLIGRHPIDCSFAAGTAHTAHSGTQTIATSQNEEGQYYLLDNSRGLGLHTLSQGRNLYDADNEWRYEQPAQQMALDVHYAMGLSYDFFSQRYERNSLDWNGLALRAVTGEPFANAHYSGDGSLGFGAGDLNSDFDLPFSSVDVVGHEIAHGLTAYSSNLLYFGESGGLNEAFSDILGVTIERYYHPEQSSWIIGDQFSSSGSYFRNMANPEEKHMPDTYQGNYWRPSLEVHSGSSIANYWFFLLSEGQAGTNDLGYAYDIPTLGYLPTADIVYQAWTYLLSPTSNYTDAALATVFAATEIYGECSPEVLAVQEAWRAVNVFSATHAALSVSTHRLCNRMEPVEFRAETAGEFVRWDFGDGHSSTENPTTHTYLTSGTYQPTASILDCAGQLFEQRLYAPLVVNYESHAFCDTTILLSGQSQLINSCSGIITDDGGRGNYSNGVLGEIQLRAEGVAAYSFEFEEFSTEGNFDFLQVYTAGHTEPLYVFDGHHRPPPFTVVGNSVRIVFISDGSVTYPGFSLAYHCHWPAAPQADFEQLEAVDDCQSFRSFHSTSTGFPTSFRWLLDGRVVGTDSELFLDLSGHTDGRYQLVLEACNALACDTYTDFSPILLDRSGGSCDVLSMESGEHQLTNCLGVLVDDGGTAGHYSDNVFSRIELKNDEGLHYLLNFVNFQLEANWDYFRVYRLVDGEPELLDAFTGALPPFSKAYPYSQLLLEFDTDGSGIYSGFEIQYSCVDPRISIDDEPALEWQLFPNPFSEQFQIIRLPIDHDWTLRLLSMNGQLVQEEVFASTSAGRSLRVKTNDLAAGVYLLQLIDVNGQLHTRRIVKQ